MDGLGRGFSRDVEAILGVVQLGAQLQETYIYPHEVRENLRRAGMTLDNRCRRAMSRTSASRS
jgi:hypothetical protein